LLRLGPPRPTYMVPGCRHCAQRRGYSARCEDIRLDVMRGRQRRRGEQAASAQRAARPPRCSFTFTRVYARTRMVREPAEEARRLVAVTLAGPDGDVGSRCFSGGPASSGMSAPLPRRPAAAGGDVALRPASSPRLQLRPSMTRSPPRRGAPPCQSCLTFSAASAGPRRAHSGRADHDWTAEADGYGANRSSIRSPSAANARSPSPAGQERQRQDDHQRDHGGAVLSDPFECLLQHGCPLWPWPLRPACRVLPQPGKRTAGSSPCPPSVGRAAARAA
jgi:hypothetical protein